jgi:hypothetical protein
VILALALIATLGGCATTTAGDGDLVDDWAALPSAAPKVPASGVCYSASDVYASRIGGLYTDPIACTTSHAVEAFHVGDLPADVTLPPQPGKPEFWRTFEECERRAKDFLGDEWYNGRLYLRVTVPLTRQWEGGARWYRCELIETKTMYSDTVAKRESSLASGLRDAAPVAQRCADIVGEKAAKDWDDLTPVDCAQPHDTEYVGSFRVPGTTMPADDRWESIFEGCWDVVARFTGGTRSGVRLGYLSWTVSEDGWNRGDRWVRCYAWGEKKMVGSVKGIGNAAPRTG